MATTVNRTDLTGNLGNDPEQRIGSNGTLIATASIAVHSSYSRLRLRCRAGESRCSAVAAGWRPCSLRAGARERVRRTQAGRRSRARGGERAWCHSKTEMDYGTQRASVTEARRPQGDRPTTTCAPNKHGDEQSHFSIFEVKNAAELAILK